MNKSSNNCNIVTNIYDKGNIYILDTSEPKPCVPKKQQYLKRVFHTPNSDTSVIIAKPKIKLTRNPPTLNEDIWDKYNKEFENGIALREEVLCQSSLYQT